MHRREPAAPLAPGFRVDRYEMLCPIGEGGMASVWAARLHGKRGFEKLVAIKTILPRFATDKRFQEMFLDEARIASGIHHVNVAQILDLGEEHDVLYLVMEWVDGDALSRLHRTADEARALVPPGIVLRILADVCGGLHAAHETTDKSGAPLGVVHRDVSPQNVLVGVSGVAKLIDFGIAKVRDRVAGDTSAGTLKGKIRYMAPEQALGQPIDRRADVWAVGAVLYHLLAGRPPFEGPNEAATLIQLTAGKPPRPLPDSVPAPVVDVVCKALTHDPRRRYATALDLQRALERAMVDADLTTTVADVAEYCATHLSEPARARKTTIERALEAAGERAREALEAREAREAREHVGEAFTPAPATTQVTPSQDTPGPRPALPKLPAKRYALLAAAAMAVTAIAMFALRPHEAPAPAPAALVAEPPAATITAPAPSEPSTVALAPSAPPALSVKPASAAPTSPITPPSPRPRARPSPPTAGTPAPSGSANGHRGDYGF